MTQALSGAAIAAVIAVCWLLGRPRPKLLRSTDASGVAALNRQQMELVVVEAGPADPAAGAMRPAAMATAAAGWPRDARERALLLKQLNTQYGLGGEARRQAMALAAAWGHRAVLPLLKRGLRDPDPAVVVLAAGAMERFRGSRGPMVQPAAKAPRNVSRTR